MASNKHNDSRRSDTEIIDVAAAMVSDAGCRMREDGTIR